MSIVSRIRNFFSAGDPAVRKSEPIPAADPVSGSDPFPRSLGNHVLPLEASYTEAEVQRRRQAKAAAQHRIQRDAVLRRLRDQSDRDDEARRRNDTTVNDGAMLAALVMASSEPDRSHDHRWHDHGRAGEVRDETPSYSHQQSHHDTSAPAPDTSSSDSGSSPSFD